MADSENEYDFDEFNDYDEEEEDAARSNQGNTSKGKTSNRNDTTETSDVNCQHQKAHFVEQSDDDAAFEEYTFASAAAIDSDHEDNYMISFPPSMKVSNNAMNKVSTAEGAAEGTDMSVKQASSTDPYDFYDDEIEDEADDFANASVLNQIEYIEPTVVSPIKDDLVAFNSVYNDQYTDSFRMLQAPESAGANNEYDFDFEDDNDNANSLTIDDCVVAVGSPQSGYGNDARNAHSHGAAADEAGTEVDDGTLSSTYYSSPTRAAQQQQQPQRQQSALMSLNGRDSCADAKEVVEEVEDTIAPVRDLNLPVQHAPTVVTVSAQKPQSLSFDSVASSGGAAPPFDSSKLLHLKKTLQKRKRAVHDDETSDTPEMDPAATEKATAMEVVAPLESPAKKANTTGKASSSAGEAIKNEFRLLGLDALSPEIRPKLSLIHQKTSSAAAAAKQLVAASVPEDVRYSAQADVAAAPVSIDTSSRVKSGGGRSAGPGVVGDAAGENCAMKVSRNVYGKYLPPRRKLEGGSPIGRADAIAGTGDGGADVSSSAASNAGGARAGKVTFSNVDRLHRKDKISGSVAAHTPAMQTGGGVGGGGRTQQRVSLKPALPVRKIRLIKPVASGNAPATTASPAASPTKAATLKDSECDAGGVDNSSADAAQGSSACPAPAAAGGGGVGASNPGHAHRKVRLSTVTTSAATSTAAAPVHSSHAAALQPKPPTKPSVPKQQPTSHQRLEQERTGRVVLDKVEVMPASVLEENSTYSTLLDAHGSTYSDDDGNYSYQLYDNGASGGINDGCDDGGSISTVKINANDAQNSPDGASAGYSNSGAGSSGKKKPTRARFADASPEENFHHSHHSHRGDPRYAYDVHDHLVCAEVEESHAGKVRFSDGTEANSGVFVTHSPQPQEQPQQQQQRHSAHPPDTSRSAPEHRPTAEMYHTNNIPGVPVRRRSKGAGRGTKRSNVKQNHFYHPQQPVKQDVEKNNPRVLKYNRGRDWMADPSHRYDESTGLFSSFETDAKREFRKEQARVNALLKKQAAAKEAEAARAAYLQRKHESEVQAQLREQAYLSEANTREERYEAALAQHKLAEMKAIQEREEVRAKMQLLSEMTSQSKNHYIKYASNFMGPPPPSTQEIEAQLRSNLNDSPGSPKRHYVPHSPPSHEKTQYHSSGDDHSPSPPSGLVKSAGSRRKHTAPKTVAGEDSVSSYNSTDAAPSVSAPISTDPSPTAPTSSAVLPQHQQGNVKQASAPVAVGGRYPRKGRQIVEQKHGAANNHQSSSAVPAQPTLPASYSNTSKTAQPAGPVVATKGLQHAQITKQQQHSQVHRAHPPAPRGGPPEHHHNHPLSHSGGHPHHPHQPPTQHSHPLDESTSRSTVVAELHQMSVDSVLTDYSANPSVMEYRNNSSAYFSHDNSQLLGEAMQEVGQVAVGEVEEEEVLDLAAAALHNSSSASLSKSRRRSLNQILSAAASRVKVDLFGDEVDVTSIQHDIDAGLTSYHTGGAEFDDTNDCASDYPGDDSLDANNAYYMVQVQSMVGIDATDMMNIEIHDFYSESPRNSRIVAGEVQVTATTTSPGLTLEDAFNFAGELDLPLEESEGSLPDDGDVAAEETDFANINNGDGGDGEEEREGYSDDGWEADEFETEDPEFESQQETPEEDFTSPPAPEPARYATFSQEEEKSTAVPESGSKVSQRASTPKARAGNAATRATTTTIGASDEDDYDNEYADESFEQPSSRMTSASAVSSAVHSAVPTLRSALHSANHPTDGAADQHKNTAHASFAAQNADDDEHVYHHRIIRKSTPVRKTRLVSPPAPAPAPIVDDAQMLESADCRRASSAGKRKSTPAAASGKRAASAVSTSSGQSQDYGDDFENDFENDLEDEPDAVAENQEERHGSAETTFKPNSDAVTAGTNFSQQHTAENGINSHLVMGEDDNNSLDLNSSLPNSPLLGLRLGSSVDFQDSLAFSTMSVTSQQSNSNTLSYSPAERNGPAGDWGNTQGSYYISQNNSVYEDEAGAAMPKEEDSLVPVFPSYALQHQQQLQQTGTRNHVSAGVEDNDADDIEELPVSAPKTAQSDGDGYEAYDNDFEDDEAEPAAAEREQQHEHASPATAQHLSQQASQVKVPVIPAAAESSAQASSSSAGGGYHSDDSGEGDGLYQFVHSNKAASTVGSSVKALDVHSLVPATAPVSTATPAEISPERFGLPEEVTPTSVNARMSNVPPVQEATSTPISDFGAETGGGAVEDPEYQEYSDDFDNGAGDDDGKGAGGEGLLFFNDGEDLTANPQLQEGKAHFKGDLLMRGAAPSAETNLSAPKSTPAPYSVRSFSMVVTDSTAAPDLFGRGAAGNAAIAPAGKGAYDAKKTDLLERIKQQQLYEDSDSDLEVDKYVEKTTTEPPSHFKTTSTFAAPPAHTAVLQGPTHAKSTSTQLHAAAPDARVHIATSVINGNDNYDDDDLYAAFSAPVPLPLISKTVKQPSTMLSADCRSTSANDSSSCAVDAPQTSLLAESQPSPLSAPATSVPSAGKQTSFRSGVVLKGTETADSATVAKSTPAPYSVRSFSMVVTDSAAAAAAASGGAGAANAPAVKGAFDAKKTDLLERIKQQQLLEGSDSEAEADLSIQQRKTPLSPPRSVAPPAVTDAPVIASHTPAAQAVLPPMMAPATKVGKTVAVASDGGDDYAEDGFEDDYLDHELDELDISADTTSSRSPSHSRLKKDKKSSKHSKRGKHKKSKKEGKQKGGIEDLVISDEEEGFSSDGSGDFSPAAAARPSDRLIVTTLARETHDHDSVAAKLTTGSNAASRSSPPPAVILKAQPSFNNSLQAPLPSLTSQTSTRLPEISAAGRNGPQASSITATPAYHPLADEDEDEYDFDAPAAALAGTIAIDATMKPSSAAFSPSFSAPANDFHHVDDGEDEQEDEFQSSFQQQHDNAGKSAKASKKDRRSTKHSKHGKHKKSKKEGKLAKQKGAGGGIEDLVISDEEDGFSSDGSGDLSSTASPARQNYGAENAAAAGSGGEEACDYTYLNEHGSALTHKAKQQEADGYDQYAAEGGDYAYQDVDNYGTEQDPHYAYGEGEEENHEFALEYEQPAFSPSSKHHQSAARDSSVTFGGDVTEGGKHKKDKKDKKDKKSKSKHKHKHKSKKAKKGGDSGSADGAGSVEALDDFDSDSSEDTESTSTSSPVPLHHQHQHHHHLHHHHHHQAQQGQTQTNTRDHFDEDEFDF